MQFLGRKSPSDSSKPGGSHVAPSNPIIAEQRITLMACILGAVASIGGFMFGYVRYVMLCPRRHLHP